MMPDERPIVKLICVICGDVKNHGQRNKRRCPERRTHKWMLYEIRDMTRCPDCLTKQHAPKKVGDSCENSNCESEVINYYNKPAWFNPNWD